MDHSKFGMMNDRLGKLILLDMNFHKSHRGNYSQDQVDLQRTQLYNCLSYRMSIYSYYCYRIWHTYMDIWNKQNHLPKKYQNIHQGTHIRQILRLKYLNKYHKY